MVLVSVGYKYASYLVRVAYEVGDIGYNEVDARHIIVGKAHAAVDDYYIVTVLDAGHILAYLVDTAERVNSERKKVAFFFFCHKFSFLKWATV